MSVLCPLVSVILPVRNEAPFIDRVLRAVLDQDYPHDLIEVIVADGMSEDGTRKIVRALADRDARLRMLDNPDRIAPAGLNLAIRAARGDVMMRVDGHGVLPPNYVSECLKHLKEESGGQWLAVGGAWDCVGRGPVGEAIARATSSRFGVGGSHYRTCSEAGGPILTDSVPFWVMRREVFEQLGLFREEMLCHEDYEFNYRLRRSGGRILLLPWLRSKYFARSTLGGVARQYWKYGIWKGRFLCSHPESLKVRHLIPPLFVAALVAGALASFLGAAGRFCLGSLVALYVCFLMLASVSLIGKADTLKAEMLKPEAGRQKADGRGRSSAVSGQWSVVGGVVFLPIILATLHLCWGAGVWLGLLRGKVVGQPPGLK